MKKRIFTTAAFVCRLMVCLAAIADLSGKWTSTFSAPDGSQYPLTYTFKADGSKLTGTLEAAGSVVPIDSGMVKDDNVSFNVTVQGVTYAHKGKYYAAGDSIGVDVSFEGNKGHMTMKRAQ
jgi:hypothetical protein